MSDVQLEHPPVRIHLSIQITVPLPMHFWWRSCLSVQTSSTVSRHKRLPFQQRYLRSSRPSSTPRDVASRNTNGAPVLSFYVQFLYVCVYLYLHTQKSSLFHCYIAKLTNLVRHTNVRINMCERPRCCPLDSNKGAPSIWRKFIGKRSIKLDVVTVDPDQGGLRTAVVKILLCFVAESRNELSAADLHNHELQVRIAFQELHGVLPKLCISLVSVLRSDVGTIAEHQNVWSCRSVTLGTYGLIVERHRCSCLRLIGIYIRTAWCCALCST